MNDDPLYERGLHLEQHDVHGFRVVDEHDCPVWPKDETEPVWKYRPLGDIEAWLRKVPPGEE